MNHTRYSNGSEFNTSLAARNGSLTQRVKYLLSKRTVCVSTLMYGCTGLVQVNLLCLLWDFYFYEWYFFRFLPLFVLFTLPHPLHLNFCRHLLPFLVYLYSPSPSPFSSSWCLVKCFLFGLLPPRMREGSASKKIQCLRLS